jgi:hypothetical protein
MAFALEYHKAVQRSILASLALFGMLFFTPVSAFSSPAQVSGSATSAGASGGHGFSGGGPSAISPGHNFAPPTGAIAPPTGAISPPTGAIAPPTSSVNSHNQGFANHVPHSGGHGHHHAAFSDFYYPYGYAVPVPYAIDNNGDNSGDDDDSEYQGGPTVFDRRGSGRDSYVPPSDPGPAHARQSEPAGDPPASESNSIPAAETPQPATTIVFRDGHQVEVANYAIVGQTLYDLTPGHPRKIALGDLDLSATQKQNDDRGITFQLPPSAQAN